MGEGIRNERVREENIKEGWEEEEKRKEICKEHIETDMDGESSKEGQCGTIMRKDLDKEAKGIKRYQRKETGKN